MTTFVELGGYPKPDDEIVALVLCGVNILQ